MALTTRGFSVDVLPTFQMPDPRLLAWDPSQAIEGAKGVMQLANAFEARKGAKAQREALQFQTEQARVTAPLILRDLQARVQAGELSLDEAKALAPAKIAAAQAQFGAQAKLAMPEANFRLGQIGAAEKLLPGQTENDLLKQALEGKAVRSGIARFDETEGMKRETAKAELDLTKAKAAEAQATADRYRAMAQASLAEPSKMDEEFAKGIGKAANALGIQPSKLLAAISSDVVNKDGIPVATELSSFAQNIQSATNAIDIKVALSGLSDEAKSVLRGEKVSGSAPAKGGSSEPAVIKVGKDGKVTIPKVGAADVAAPAEEAAVEAAFTDQDAPDPSAATQPQSDGSSVLPGLVTTGGAGAIYALTNPRIQAALQNAPANLAKAAKNAWVGRGPGGTFTGQGISNQLSRLGKSPIKMGAGPAALAATLGNEAIPMVLNTRLGEALIGKRGTDRSTDNLTVAEGVAKAITADSFDEMVAQTSYDEAINLIDRIRASSKITPEKKQEAISALLERIRTIDIGR